MLLDYGQELTEDGGLNMGAKALDTDFYGDKPYDLGSASPGDAAVGERITCYFQVLDADFDDITSADISVVNDEDGAGTNEVVLLTETVALADLTVAAGVRRLGTIEPGLITKQYLAGKVRMTGGSAPENEAKVKIFFQVGDDVAPANAGRTI